MDKFTRTSTFDLEEPKTNVNHGFCCDGNDKDAKTDLDLNFFISCVKTFHDKEIIFSHKNDMDFSIKSYSLSKCIKADCHKDFIPIGEIDQITSLPLGYRTQEILDYVHNVSKMVVKVTVHFTSPHRQYSEKYRLGDINDLPDTRQGTGWLCMISDDDMPEKVPCEDPDCKFSDVFHFVVGPIYVITARHLVFDHLEAVQTNIVYTNDNPVDDLNSKIDLLTAEGDSVMITPDEERDFVYVKCYSHDGDQIVSHLESVTSCLEKASPMSLETYDRGSGRTLDNEKQQEFGFVISHPHNRSKHISFGPILEQEDIDEEFDMKTGDKARGLVKYVYDIPTCPGSSGAPVCVMGRGGAYHYLSPHSLVDGDERRGTTTGLVDWVVY